MLPVCQQQQFRRRRCSRLLPKAQDPGLVLLHHRSKPLLCPLNTVSLNLTSFYLVKLELTYLGGKAPGDRSHIPADAMPIFEILSADMERVKGRAPSSFKAQVEDAERRLSILFDHLNNEDLLKSNTISDMVQLSNAIQARDYETARTIHVDLMANRTEECGNWMVSDNLPQLKASITDGLGDRSV